MTAEFDKSMGRAMSSLQAAHDAIDNLEASTPWIRVDGNRVTTVDADMYRHLTRCGYSDDQIWLYADMLEADQPRRTLAAVRSALDRSGPPQAGPTSPGGAR